jgi:hypothetical protein
MIMNINNALLIFLIISFIVYSDTLDLRTVKQLNSTNSTNSTNTTPKIVYNHIYNAVAFHFYQYYARCVYKTIIVLINSTLMSILISLYK